MPFRELINEFRIGLAQDSYVVRRKFIDTTNILSEYLGDTSHDFPYLPFPGDSILGLPADTIDALPFNGAFDNTPFNPDIETSKIDITKLHVVNIEAQPFNYQSHNIYAYTVDYGNSPAEDVRITTDLKVGTEVMTLDNEAAQNGIKFATSHRQIPFYYSKLISTAEYTVSQTYSTMQQAVQFMTIDDSGPYYMSDYVGKVQPMFVTDGFWLFAGFEVNEYVMRTGQIWFKRTEHYKFRRINDSNITGPGGTSGGWNLLWNPFEKQWELTTPLIYQMTASASDFPRQMPLI